LFETVGIGQTPSSLECYLVSTKLNNTHATRTIHIIFRWPSTKFQDFSWPNEFHDFPDQWEPCGINPKWL